MGIGTSSPGAKLQIGSATFAPNGNLSNNLLQIKSSSGFAYLTIGNGDSANSTSYIGGASGFIVLGSVTDAGAASEHIRMTNTGLVGIGTTSPSSKLHSVVTTAGDSALKLQDDTGSVFDFQCGIAGVTGDALLIKDTTLSKDYLTLRSGNVGIGTTSPAATLDVDDDNTGKIRLLRNGSTRVELSNNANEGELSLYRSSTAKTIYISSYYNSYFNGGNVGIGTTSISGVKFQAVQTTSGEWTGGFKNYTSNGYGLRVDMSGSSSVQSALQVYTGSGTGFVVKNNGNVGVGTFTPTRKLDVAGEITHEGLVPKAGAFVDGLVTIDKTVSTTANTWTSLDISLSNIGGTGTFAVQVYSNAHGGTTNAAWYNMYWSGIMSWFHSATNDNDTEEIPLHMAGHARNNGTLELRTLLHTADGTSYANRCELQIKTANALSSAPISFRFRKLL